MKKIMILMLSLAVLFSFAACDNSSNTPSDTTDDDQPAITSGAALAAAESSVVAAEFGKINTSFGADAKIWDTDKLGAGYSVDLAGNSITWTQAYDEAVVDLETTYTTITVSGADITPVANVATQKVILLDSYTLEFCQPISSNALTSGFASGTVSGDMIGKVTITLADGKVTGVTVAVASTPEMTGLTGKIPTAVVSFLPTDASDVELNYDGAEVDAQKFVDYINSARVNDALENGYDVADTLTSYALYKAYWDAQYESDAYTKLSAAILDANDGIANLIDFDKPGLSSTYNYGQSESSATITFTNGTEADVTFVAADSGYTYSVPVGGTVTIALSGKTATTTTF